MAQNCDPQSLVNSPNVQCIYCSIPPGMQLPVLISLLCQIVQNGTGGGGSGTVTSFSAGNLSPLFTTSVATATTTPALTFALSTQTANTLFAGPTSGGAAGPTFRAMVEADLGTTLAPQMARLGLGTGADAAIQLFALHPSSGAGVTVDVARFDATTSDPASVWGGTANNAGCRVLYSRVNNTMVLGVNGAQSLQIDGSGNCNLSGGVYEIAGTPGLSQTFDIGGGNTQITFTGGIATSIV